MLKAGSAGKGVAGPQRLFVALEKIHHWNFQDFTGLIQTKRADGCFPFFGEANGLRGQAQCVRQVIQCDVLALALLL